MTVFHQAAASLRTRSAQIDAGYTLVELLVAMTLFLALSGLILSGVLTMSNGLDKVRGTSEITAEARVALERIARDVRQGLLREDLGPVDSTNVTAWVNLDGDADIDEDAQDPELVTYTYDNANDSITLTGRKESGAPISGASAPLLAGHVKALTFTYWSSNWWDDTDGDGQVTQLEAGTGGVDRIQISLDVMSDGGELETFATDVTLRNRSLS